MTGFLSLLERRPRSLTNNTGRIFRVPSWNLLNFAKRVAGVSPSAARTGSVRKPCICVAPCGPGTRIPAPAAVDIRGPIWAMPKRPQERHPVCASNPRPRAAASVAFSVAALPAWTAPTPSTSGRLGRSQEQGHPPAPASAINAASARGPAQGGPFPGTELPLDARPRPAPKPLCPQGCGRPRACHNTLCRLHTLAAACHFCFPGPRAWFWALPPPLSPGCPCPHRLRARTRQSVPWGAPGAGTCSLAHFVALKHGFSSAFSLGARGSQASVSLVPKRSGEQSRGALSSMWETGSDRALVGVRPGPLAKWAPMGLEPWGWAGCSPPEGAPSPQSHAIWKDLKALLSVQNTTAISRTR